MTDHERLRWFAFGVVTAAIIEWLHAMVAWGGS